MSAKQKKECASSSCAVQLAQYKRRANNKQHQQQQQPNITDSSAYDSVLSSYSEEQLSTVVQTVCTAVERATNTEEESPKSSQVTTPTSHLSAKLIDTPMTSSDSGVDSSAEVDPEMKESTCRDEAAASPSDSSSDDVAVPTSNSNVQGDVIICGDCHMEFAVSQFSTFIDHKVNR
ncbi:hypothetical protein AB6A40_000963 [Gnathostoma spinigerum]|uniref:BCL-11A-like CCHC zinc finger domain-containing protein n=1 Tax=Gnathostoma spinigerum TaxID=75299 RepID=A0ABD6EA73_9BILA